MDVAEFFSELRRMCKSSSDCAKCQYHGNKCDNANEIFEKTVAVVEKWSQEHPRKTRQSELICARLPGWTTFVSLTCARRSSTSDTENEEEEIVVI